MNRWRQLWKDVLLTGAGVVVILLQATVYEAHPQPYIVLAGLALTVPSAAEHIRALLAPSGDSSSSESSRSAGERPSTSSGGGSHDD